MQFSANILPNNSLAQPSPLRVSVSSLGNPRSATVNLNDILTQDLNPEAKKKYISYYISFLFLGSRKGRYDFFRKHEYVMRNRELGKKTKDGAKETKENRSQTPEGIAGVTRLTPDVSNTDTRTLNSVDCPRSSTELQPKTTVSSITNVATITTSSKPDGSTRFTSHDPCSSAVELGGTTDLQNFIASSKATVAPSPMSTLSVLSPTVPDGIEHATPDSSDISPSVSTNSSMLSNVSNSFNYTEPSNREASDEVRSKYFYSLMEE